MGAILFLVGGGITLYIIYKVMIAIIEPVVTKKLQQQMTEEKLSQLQNNLAVHKQIATKALQKNNNGEKTN